MNPERRYNEEEIAGIFKQAAGAQEAARRHLSDTEGLTLPELQQIGKEAGITPEFIARAAAAVDRTGSVLPPKRFLGLPISVERTVDLPGPLSDAHWDRLVVDLRETFQAHGTQRREGSLREWRNGNLRALVEPTDTGYRLRLHTVKGNAMSRLLGGLAACVLGLTLLLSTFSGDLTTLRVMMLSLITVVGAGSLGFTAYGLPRWARERARQMEAIVARTVERAGALPAPPLPQTAPPLRPDLAAPTDEAPVDEAPARSRNRTRS